MDVAQRWSKTQPDIRRLAPRLGEHSREILDENGLGAEEIGKLLESGAVIQG